MLLLDSQEVYIKMARKRSSSWKQSLSIPEQKPFESDFQYFKRLAKQADQRLLRLERLSSDPLYKDVKQYAYANAMHDIKRAARDTGATRFNRMPARTKEGAIDQRVLRANINAVKRFLGSASSQKSTITKVYKDRADTINRRYGTNFSWQDLSKFFDRQQNKLSDSKYGSKTVLRAVAAIQSADDKIINEIKASGYQDIRVSDDSIINEAAQYLLESGQIDI